MLAREHERRRFEARFGQVRPLGHPRSMGSQRIDRHRVEAHVADGVVLGRLEDDADVGLEVRRRIDPQRRAVKIDRTPPQRAQLAPTGAGGCGEAYEHPERDGPEMAH